MVKKMKVSINKSLSIFVIALFCCSLLFGESYLGTKAPAEPKAVGDIVFNDGSATPYKSKLKLSDEQKKAAIAVIFYVGTDCSDDGSNRILGVGLNYSPSKLPYCDMEASSRFDSINTIYDTKNGSQNLEKIGEWLIAHDKIDDTGDALKYPAFYFAKNYIEYVPYLEDFSEGWYLPSKEEMSKIYKKRNTINNVCKLCDLPVLKDIGFWTSTQSYNEKVIFDISANAFMLNPVNGYCSELGVDKNNFTYACVIRDFN